MKFIPVLRGVVLAVTVMLAVVSLTASASTIPDHLIMATLFNNDNRASLIDGTSPQNKTITSELFTSTGMGGTSNYGELFLAFDTPAHVSQICWTNGNYGSYFDDYMRGADLMFDTTDDYGVYQTAGSNNSGFAANATACVAADTTQWSKYWKVVMSPPAKWRHWADVDITVSFSETVTPTPTATPNMNIATPQLQGIMPCITATVAASSTAMPTRTPVGPTPTGSTPVATPSPTPTRDVAPPTTGDTTTPIITPTVISYDGGLMKFSSDLEQLSAYGSVNMSNNPSNFLNWSNATGQDGMPGVAMMHAYMDDVTTSTTSAMSTVATFKASGYVAPIALTWYARTAYTLTTEATHTMRVWYLDPDYYGNGTGVWVATSTLATDKQLSNEWRKFGVVITPHGGSGRVTGIGFTDNYVTQHFASTSPCPSQNGCIYVDDVHLTYGAANALILPVCGSGSTTTGQGTHICAIAQHTVDVMGQLCKPPSSFLDIGGYIAWLGCSLKTYFTILPENSSQIIAVARYANGEEPFGSLRETSDGMGYIGTSVSAYSERYSNYTRNTTDWGKFFNWAAVLHMQLPNFTGNETATDQDMTGCQFASVNYDVPLDVLRPACFVERFTTDSGLLAPIQILIDLFCVAAVFMYVRNNWMASMGGDG